MERVTNDRKVVDKLMEGENKSNNSILSNKDNNIIDRSDSVTLINDDQYFMNQLFDKINILKVFIRSIVDKKVFIIGNLKRAMNKYIYAINTNNNKNTPISVNKPSGLNVKEMYYSNPTLFGYGHVKLPYTSYPLKSKVILDYHERVCEGCNDKCYIHELIKCIEYGWCPPIDRDNIVSKYNVDGNYRTVDQYQDGCQKEVNEMIEHGVLIRSQGYTSGIINPLGAVVKNSDKLRAKTLVGVHVVDQKSLTDASTKLVDKGYNKIKTRITTDMTATGVNGACISPPFSYPSFSDGINIIERNAYLGKTDISRYFHSFPLSFDIRDLFRVIFLGLLYCYARCCFGFSPCPYYCSTWSAEFRSWILKLVGPCAHMMDDWLMTGRTMSEVKEKISTLAAIFLAIGFSIAMEKNEYGQQITYLGFLLDTVKMTVRIDPTQARGEAVQMENYLNMIINNKYIDKTTIMSVAGKLNWYSEIIQSGRIHIKAWWDYHKYGHIICSITRQRLISDTCWWIQILTTWSHGEQSQLEYPLWTSSEVLENPKSIYIIQSDASGTDGYGYYHGWLQCEELSYVSRTWDDAGPDRDHTKSHRDELTSLMDILITNNNSSHHIYNCILIWITDSQSGVYSVNKGNCTSKDSANILRIILEKCDDKKISLVGLWVPREENELADYLSHLSYNLNRSSAEGNISELEGTPSFNSGGY